MSDNDASQREKVDAVLDWAEDHEFFDPQFIESLASWLEDNDELTEKQEEALDRIIERFNIEIP